jgi:hypothetical protein
MEVLKKSPLEISFSKDFVIVQSIVNASLNIDIKKDKKYLLRSIDYYDSDPRLPKGEVFIRLLNLIDRGGNIIHCNINTAMEDYNDLNFIVTYNCCNENETQIKIGDEDVENVFYRSLLNLSKEELAKAIIAQIKKIDVLTTFSPEEKEEYNKIKNKIKDNLMKDK